MRLVELNKGWKTFGIVVLTLIAITIAFCVVTAILAHNHNVGFVEEIQSWFGIVKEVVETIPSNPDETVTTAFKLVA